MNSSVTIKMSDHNRLSKPGQLQESVHELTQVAQALLQRHPNISYTSFTDEIKNALSFATDNVDDTHVCSLKKQFQQRAQYFLAQSGSPTEVQVSLVNEHLNYVLKNTISTHLAQLYQPHITIVGAGLAGLLAAFVFAKYQAKITIYESRTEQDARLRPQNISFKEAELRLKPLLGENLYQQFFQMGGALDGQTGKLRITTGAFQDILTQALRAQDIQIHYEQKIHAHDLLNMRDTDAILIATGVHACERLGLHEHFQPQFFPTHAAHGRTALCIQASQATPGYRRSEREGYHWRRDNISVFSGQTLQADLRRMIRNVTKTTGCQTTIKKLSNLINHPNVEYTFIFGNDTEQFLQDFPQPLTDYLIQESHYQVLPMITQTPVSKLNRIPLIAIGDANGSPHPLAAIGTLKFLRNVTHLRDFIYTYHCLQKLQCWTTENSDRWQALKQLRQMSQQTYIATALQNNKEVFYGNILSSLYSQPRLT